MRERENVFFFVFASVLVMGLGAAMKDGRQVLLLCPQRSELGMNDPDPLYQISYLGGTPQALNVKSLNPKR